jgi:hypothetical protein
MKKKVAKNPHSSTEPRILTRYGTWWESMQAQNLTYRPHIKEWRDELINTMYCFFDDPDTLELEEFCQAYKLSPFTLRNWRKKYDDIKEAVDCIKVIIGVKRRKGVHQFKLKESSCYKDMHKLDPEWAEIDQYHARLKAAEQEVEKDFTVIMKTAKAKDVS